MVSLGTVGRNVAAGMTGGLGYFYDASGDFPDRVNGEIVAVQRVVTAAGGAHLRALVEAHVERTGGWREGVVLRALVGCRAEITEVGVLGVCFCLMWFGCLTRPAALPLPLRRVCQGHGAAGGLGQRGAEVLAAGAALGGQHPRGVAPGRGVGSHVGRQADGGRPGMSSNAPGTAGTARLPRF